MNYVPDILEQLARGRGFSEILLAPGARPYVRESSGLRSFGDNILMPDDILETLTTLAARIPAGGVTLDKVGVFSFGIPQRGRFRVSYLTQRGSYAVSITEIPLVVPDLGEVLADAEIVREFEGRVLQSANGLFVLASSASLLVNTLAYSLLKRINDAQPRVIFTLEPYVTYILKHNKSVVLQSEVGGDVASVEEGVQAAMNLSPNVLYVRGIGAESDLNAVLKAVKSGVLTFITVSKADMQTLFPSGRPPRDASLLQGVWPFEPMDDSGKLWLQV